MTEGHMNILIYNSRTRELQRFEPNGVTIKYDGHQIDDVLQRDFLRHDERIRYVPASTVCPFYGFQSYQDTHFPDKRHGTEIHGYCSAWSLWYLELRLRNPERDAKEIERDSFEILTKRTNIGDFIKAYADFLFKMRTVLKETAKTAYNTEITDSDLQAYEENEGDLVKKRIIEHALHDLLPFTN
jgi:hypothetical protein